jgi:DNA topoisomerase-1
MPGKERAERRRHQSPDASAAAARLRYVEDRSLAGIHRVRSGNGFAYHKPDGRDVRNAETLQRIRRLAIPPAWVDVWICPLADGHIQATGRDSRGRKQYRYHERWREIRDATKYDRLVPFARVLPVIRARVADDLASPGLTRGRVLAALTRLLDVALIRVGGREYAKDNRSYGLTTMRARHVGLNGARITFDFRGKSGVHHVVDVRDRRVARVLRRCLELPGQDLFQYLDDAGARQAVTSDDVNGYLREISGGDFTTKDFRTWTATVMMVAALQQCDDCESSRERQRHVTQAIEQVSRALGNTPAVCRRCYIHPYVFAAHESGSLPKVRSDAEPSTVEGQVGLRADERAVLRLLDGHRAGSSRPQPRHSSRDDLRAAS